MDGPWSWCICLAQPDKTRGPTSEKAMSVCADEVSDDADVEFCYGNAKDGAGDEEGGVSEEQEGIARANGRERA